MQQIAYDFADLDNTAVTACDELVAALERFGASIKESIEYLNSVPEEE